MSDSYRRLMGQLTGEEDDQNAYQAFPSSRSAPSKLTLRLADGRRLIQPYRFLMNVDCLTLPNGDWLISLLYPSRSIIVEGPCLAEVEKRLEDDTVAWLQEFDPKRWSKPSENTPVILKITINTAS